MRRFKSPYPRDLLLERPPSQAAALVYGFDALCIFVLGLLTVPVAILSIFATFIVLSNANRTLYSAGLYAMMLLHVAVLFCMGAPARGRKRRIQLGICRVLAVAWICAAGYFVATYSSDVWFAVSAALLTGRSAAHIRRLIEAERMTRGKAMPPLPDVAPSVIPGKHNEHSQ